ncbi:MAG: alpha/beta fold hydrolase [Sneathiella sp.]|uniref:bifunctional alpha/beta hydrolase/OsmC family protein n=1 Tax=Sneathiella sp. TaxID=1964365 RepID=UPI003002D5AD
MRSEKITFQGSDGMLAARLDLPIGTPKTFALFAHCFTCSKDIFAASRVAAALTDLGVATLRFDFTGLGQSDGEFENTNFSSNITDLLKAAEFLEAEYQAPSILIGHSLGGAAILAAAAQVKSAEAVVTIGAPFDPAHVGHHFMDSQTEIEEKGEAAVTIGGRPFRVKKQFIDDLHGQEQVERLKNLHKPLLIFHAPLDQTVGVNNAANIFTSAKHPKSFISLDGADHLLSKRSDAIYVADVIGSWAERYIEALQPVNIVTKLKSDENSTVVTEETPGKFVQQIDSSGHPLIADEPFSVGGSNRGPTPYDLLVSGLGACTSMTIRMYAKRKKWPLEHVAVKLRHQKIHADDCEQCETSSGKIDTIEREIELKGELSEEQRARLLEIADLCPVHKTLHSEVVIKSVLI